MQKLYTRDRGRRGQANDPDARKKLKARRDFKFIYLLCNPESEYSNYPEEEKLLKIMELLKYSMKELEEDTDLREAVREYNDIFNSIPEVRAYRSAKASFDKKLEFLNNINFEDRDNAGRYMLTMDQHSKAMKSLSDESKILKQLEENMIDELITRRLVFKRNANFSKLDSMQMTEGTRHEEGMKFG